MAHVGIERLGSSDGEGHRTHGEQADDLMLGQKRDGRDG